MTIPVVDSHTSFARGFGLGRIPSPLLRAGVLLLATAAVSACEMGGEPDAGPEQVEPEPIPEELGWTEVDGVDAAIQNRWGFVSVDIGGGKAFVFAGADVSDFGGGVLGDAFIADSSSGTPTITSVAVDNTTVPPRYCGCGTFDSTRNEVILIGGRSLQDFYIDTFVFDLDTETFTKVEAPGPTAVIGCAATYVAEEDKIFLFGGGGNGGGLLNEMWTWDGDARAWTEVTYAAGEAPIPRYDGIMRQLGGTGPLYLFAGFGDGDYLGDLWSFDIATSAWTDLTTPASPPGRRVPWMAAEPNGEGFYAGFGTFGFQPGDVHQDLWRYDVAAGEWTSLDVEGGVPPGRGFSQWLPGGPGDIGIVLGGFDGANPLSETWRLRAPETGGFF